MRRFIVVALAGLCFACAAHIPSYQVSGEDSSLRGLDKKVKVVAQTSAFKDEGSIACRGTGVVALPENQTFTAYIAAALIMELTAADLASETSDLVLSMKLEKVDFSTMLGATNWYIDTRYEIDQEVILVSTVYNDRSSYLGEKACANMAAYFQKAVSRHFRQLFNDPVVRQKMKTSK